MLEQVSTWGATEWAVAWTALMNTLVLATYVWEWFR